MQKTIDERIEAAKLKKQQAEDRIKKLLQAQRKQDRKDRTHRLCERGGKLESLLPELAKLSNEHFQIFVDKCLLTPHTRRVLTELVPPDPAQTDGGADTVQDGGTTTAEPAATAVHTEPASMPKTANTPDTAA